MELDRSMPGDPGDRGTDSDCTDLLWCSGVAMPLELGPFLLVDRAADPTERAEGTRSTAPPRRAAPACSRTSRAEPARRRTRPGDDTMLALSFSWAFLWSSK